MVEVAINALKIPITAHIDPGPIIECQIPIIAHEVGRIRAIISKPNGNWSIGNINPLNIMPNGIIATKKPALPPTSTIRGANERLTTVNPMMIIANEIINKK